MALSELDPCCHDLRSTFPHARLVRSYHNNLPALVTLLAIVNTPHFTLGFPCYCFAKVREFVTVPQKSWLRYEQGWRPECENKALCLNT